MRDVGLENKDIDISIIVPVYNAQSTLVQCIESILALEHDSMELILVNDGSTDESGKICDFYKRDSRVRVIHKKNAGCGAARNSGLSIAKGKWVLFCDSDDYYDTKVLNAMLKKLFCNDTLDEKAVVCFNFRNLWGTEIENRIHYQKACLSFDGMNEKIEFLSSEIAHKMIGYAVWDKLYSKNLIDKYGICVNERDMVGNDDDWAEDLSFNLQYFFHIDKVFVYEDAPYILRKRGSVYEQNENALVGKIDHMLKIFQKIYIEEGKKSGSVLEEYFWEIGIWHLKRYFYLDAQVLGIDGLKQEVDNCKCMQLLKSWIYTALKNWNNYGNRWDSVYSKDYKYLLEYLLDGKLLVFKLKNKFLWSRNGKKEI